MTILDQNPDHFPKNGLHLIKFYFHLIAFTCSLAYLLLFSKQDEFLTIAIPFTIAFISYFILQSYINNKNRLLIILIIGIGLRILSLFTLPTLSDDFYRYYWDGNLMLQGTNPFQYTPEEFLTLQSSLDSSMIIATEQMNSFQYHTVYPTVCQMFFAISAYLSQDNIVGFSIILKVLLLISETFLLWKISKNTIFKTKLIPIFTLYYINPLILVETFGNLHFEILMGLTFIMAVFYIMEQKYFLSWIAFATSILVKVYTVILLPFLLNFSKGKSNKSMWVFILLLSTMLIFIGPTLGNIQGYNLYLKQFEFNSFLFILLSKLLIKLRIPELWNYRGLILLSLWVIFMVIYLLRKKEKELDLIQIMLSAFILYGVFLLCHATIHPWYIITFIIFGFFSYPLTSVLSGFLITLSYIHYDELYNSKFELIRWIEYATIIIFFYIEKRTPSLTNRGS
ncbi:MAG: hypothetical protein HOP11_12345 [Saprospiraceae bacterium]|nr:hypothetical protein [Saprospiraceae bacterium]